MNIFGRSKSSSAGTALALGATTLGVLAIFNHALALRAEREHLPEGSFMDVGGIRLHYSDRGKGTPVVLIHGNMVTGDDYNTSGVAEILVRSHRVIIFDRPGFGHSDRPRGRTWTANKQADLLFRAAQQLGVSNPVVVGHSWGAIVAMAMAVRHEEDLAGVVAIGGYYFWTWRPDTLLAAVGAIPVLGDILRYTISPILNRLTMPLVKRVLFSPAPVPPRFEAEFSTSLAVRPSQIRATSEDGALMIPAALSLRDHYKNLKLPVVIIAGEGDKVVFKQRSERLRSAIKSSVLYIVRGAGHMVHHQVPAQVAEAIEAVGELSFRQAASEMPDGPTVESPRVAA